MHAHRTLDTSQSEKNSLLNLNRVEEWIRLRTRRCTVKGWIGKNSAFGEQRNPINTTMYGSTLVFVF